MKREGKGVVMAYIEEITGKTRQNLCEMLIESNVEV